MAVRCIYLSLENKLYILYQCYGITPSIAHLMLSSNVKLYNDMLYVKNLLQCYNIEYRDIDLSIKAQQEAIKTYDMDDIAFLRDLSELKRIGRGEFKEFSFKVVCTPNISRKLVYRLRELLGNEVVFRHKQNRILIRRDAAERLKK